ncbi:MAG: hypothetical protein LBS40_01610 [Burkholderiales bacterium]|nr:hypothetical protein [Burkholderiales bacterium]
MENTKIFLPLIFVVVLGFCQTPFLRAYYHFLKEIELLRLCRWRKSKGSLFLLAFDILPKSLTWHGLSGGGMVSSSKTMSANMDKGIMRVMSMVAGDLLRGP